MMEEDKHNKSNGKRRPPSKKVGSAPTPSADGFFKSLKNNSTPASAKYTPIAPPPVITTTDTGQQEANVDMKLGSHEPTDLASALGGLSAFGDLNEVLGPEFPQAKAPEPVPTEDPTTNWRLEPKELLPQNQQGARIEPLDLLQPGRSEFDDLDYLAIGKL